MQSTQETRIALRDAIIQLHHLIQRGEEGSIPRLARLQLLGVLGQLEQALTEMEAAPTGGVESTEPPRQDAPKPESGGYGEVSS